MSRVPGGVGGRSPLTMTLVLATLLLDASTALAQDPAKIAEAKKHMEAGAAFYNDASGVHKCEEALKEFKVAYDLSGSLNALKAMGVCELELERDGDAIAHYEKFLEKLGDKPHPDRTQVETDLKALKAAVAWVTLSTDRPNVRITDVRTPSRGYPITNRYVGAVGGQKLGMHPGQHVLTASSEGVADQVWKVDLGNGSTQDHTFTFDAGKPVTAEGYHEDAPPPDRTKPQTHAERPVPITVFVFGGLTAALAVPTVIFMVRAKGVKGDYDDANGKKTQAELDDMKSDVKSGNLIADIFLGATVLSAAATGVFYFTRPETQVQSAKTAIRVLPSVSTTGGGAVAIGRF